MLTEFDALMVVVMLLAILFYPVLKRPEGPSACADFCFRHQNHSRFHVPCDRCRDRHYRY